MQLGLATGNFYKHSTPVDQNKALSLLKPVCDRHDVRAIELTYGELDNFAAPLNEESVNLLRSMDEVSVHYPFKVPLGTPESRACLEKIRAIAARVPVARVIIHPDMLPDVHTIRALAKQYELVFVTEILEQKKFSLEAFKRVLDETELQFVFDVGHAESYDAQELHAFYTEYKDRICQLHINKMHNLKAHQQFVTYGLSDTLALASGLPVVGIIEEIFEPGSEALLDEEVYFLRSWLSGSK